MCSLVEFERDLIRERTTAGLAAAKDRVGNDHPAYDTPEYWRLRECYALGEAFKCIQREVV